MSTKQYIPVMDLEAAVCYGAVHGELPCALFDAPLHHITIACHVAHLQC